MVGASADDPHADAVALIPSCKAVDDVDAVAGVEVVDGTLTVDSPDLDSVLLAIEADEERRKKRIIKKKRARDGFLVLAAACRQRMRGSHAMQVHGKQLGGQGRAGQGRGHTRPSAIRRIWDLFPRQLHNVALT